MAIITGKKSGSGKKKKKLHKQNTYDSIWFYTYEKFVCEKFKCKRAHSFEPSY